MHVKTRWKIWLAGLGIFASGLLVGALAMGAIAKHKQREFPPPPPDRAHMKAMILNRLKHDLDLTQSQQEALKPLIQEGINRHAQVMVKVSPELDAVFQEMSLKIEQILTPEQITIHREMTTKFRKKRRDFLQETQDKTTP